MGFLFTSLKKEKLVAIFDIGSGSVGGALVRIPKDEKGLPTIIKSTRTDIVVRKELDFNVYMKDMILALGFTSRALFQSKLGAPSEVVCVMTSPWYLSETRVIKLEKEHSFVFTKRLADELSQKEVLSLSKTYQIQYGEVNSTPEIIEHLILGVSMNGYQVDEPLGKKTRSIEMNMVVSLVPKIFLDKIRDTISKTYHRIPVSFSSFMLSSFLAVRDKYITNDSYLLIDISGEVTDVGIVTKGVLKDSLSFPYGRKTFYRDICNKMNIEPRDASEIFSLYEKGTLADKELEKLTPILKSLEVSWIKSFKESIGTLPRTLTLPSLAFLTTDDDIKDWFVKVINSEEYLQSIVPDKQFTLVSIDGPDFLNMCNIENSSCDPFLMIEAISIMRKIKTYE